MSEADPVFADLLSRHLAGDPAAEAALRGWLGDPARRADLVGETRIAVGLQALAQPGDTCARLRRRLAGAGQPPRATPLRCAPARSAPAPRRSRRWVALAAAALLALAVGAVAWPSARGASTRVTGPAVVEQEGRRQTIPAGTTAVIAGAFALRAEAGALLEAADGSRLAPLAWARLAATGLARGGWRLDEGAVRCEIAHVDPRTPWSLALPDGRVTVKGTLFTAAVEGGTARVAVESGLVAVEHGAAVTEVAAGGSATIAGRGAAALRSGVPVATFAPEHDRGWPLPGWRTALSHRVPIGKYTAFRIEPVFAGLPGGLLRFTEEGNVPILWAEHVDDAVRDWSSAAAVRFLLKRTGGTGDWSALITLRQDGRAPVRLAQSFALPEGVWTLVECPLDDFVPVGEGAFVPQWTRVNGIRLATPGGTGSLAIAGVDLVLRSSPTP